MAKKKQPSTSIKAEATAKAELVAKATYQRKHTITEVVPADVTRAKVSAWLDLISPLTEWAGLKGDELNLRRAQLRLQREDVLAEIIRRARARLQRSSDRFEPIRNKFLVPFLEKASLEDENSPLIDMWAGLLASAAEGGSSYHIHFVSVISQLSPKQGELFGRLLRTKSANALGLGMDRIRSLESHSIRETVRKELDQLLRSNPTDFDPLVSAIADVMNCYGVEMVFGAVGIGEISNYEEIEFFNSDIYSDAIEVDFSILEAVGLIRRVEVNFELKEIYSITLEYYHLTNMGYHFANACGLISFLGEVLSISFEKERMFVALNSGRTLVVLLKHFPELLDASSSARKGFKATAVSVDWTKLGLSVPIEVLLSLDENDRSISA